MNECDSRIASKELCDLVDTGLIVQHGTRRWAFYSLSQKEAKTISKPAKKIGLLRRDRREEIIKIIKEKGECGRQELEGVLKLTGPAVLHWIRKLIKEGVIKSTTDSRKDPGAKYCLNK